MIEEIEMAVPENETPEEKATREAEEAAANAASGDGTDDKGGTPPAKPEDKEDDDDLDIPSDPEKFKAWAKEQAQKLKSANGEAAANRHKLKEYELKNEDATAKSVREAKEAGFAEAEAKYAPIIIKSAAVAALTTAGATSGHESLIKLLDRDVVKIDEDGDVVGLKEEIKRIKGEFPSLFAAEDDGKPKRRVVPGSRLDAGERTASTEKKSSAQIHAERLLGKK